MPEITFITAAGDRHVVQTTKPNLMEAAIANDIDGIYGDCGGSGSCATCHVKIDSQWIALVGTATEPELDILAFEDGSDDRSRLGCQVQLGPELDGLVVRVVSH